MRKTREDPTKDHYVNNKELFEAMIVYRKKVIDARENDLPKPKIPDYIGSCILKIATHLSYRPNFVNYMFKEDMICDGIENCIQYIDNFDPEKSKNPFAYFTQIIYFAFLRRISKEKKQLEIKNRLLEKSSFAEVFSADSSIMGYDNSEMNSIKENLEVRNKK